MKTQHTHPINKEILIGLTLAVVGVAGGTAWWTWQVTAPTADNQQPTATQPTNLPPATPLPQVSPAPIQIPSTTTSPNTLTAPLQKPTTPARVYQPKPKITTQVVGLQPQAYWLTVEGEKINLVAHKVAVKPGVSTEVALTTAFQNLLSSPHPANFSSTIPEGTRLLGLQVTDDGIYVNLSQEFTQGGGSSSMIYRVGQVLYTATSIDPQAKVFLSIEGKPLNEENALGGEGLVLRQPITRQQFVKDFSVD
jgi:spore germination protein GerM